MDFNSVFDIIGPVMVGPSSSHTAGAARIGKAVYTLFGGIPEKAEITFFGSFAQTYKGHGSDVAVIGGLLGFDPWDQRIRDSFSLAEKAGAAVSIQTSDKPTDHPNTIAVKASGKDRSSLAVTACSLGGGKIRVSAIDGFPTALSCDNPAILVFHKDRFGVVADVSNVLAKNEINIGHMEVSRREKGEDALMIIEVDNMSDKTLKAALEKLKNVTRVEIV